MIKYKIRKINNSGTIIEVLDKTFDSPEEAYRYICNNPLDGEGKYFMRQIFGEENMEENNLDDFRFEEYPNIKKSELYPKGSDMYKYYTHQEMIEDFTKNFEYEKEIKNFKGQPSKYPPLPSAEQIAEEKLSYDLTDDGIGKKYDTGKPMVGALCRVFPRALMAVGACIEFGTHKYPKPDNWKLVEGAYTRYQDSMVRHYLKHLQDQVFDNETGKLHLAHLCWNALAITELYLMEQPELMEELNK